MNKRRNLFRKRRKAIHLGLTKDGVRTLIERPRPKVLTDNIESPFEEMQNIKKEELLHETIKNENHYGPSEASNLNLYFDMKNQTPKCIVVQILLIKYYSPDDNLKNMAAKMMISDGVSCALCLLPNVVHKALSCKEIKQFDIIGIFNFEVKKLSDDNLVIVLKEPPNLIYKHICVVLGVPKEYCHNVKYGFPKVEESKIQLDDKTIYDNGYYTPLKTDKEGFTPIKCLNQYSGSFWKIKARVVKKSNKKNWKNVRGEGSLITIDLMDKEGSEIQATFFNETCEEYDEILQENRVYIFSGGSVKKAQSKYANLKNEWQITFDKKTVIEGINDDGTIQINVGSYLTLSEVASLGSQEICDVRAVVHVVGSPTSVTLKNGEEKMRKNIMLVDDTGFSICICFWGDLAINFDFSNHPVVLIKNVKIADFAGKSLNSHADSKITFDNESNRSAELRKWYGGLTAEDITRLTPLSIGTGLEKMMHEDFDRLIYSKRLQEERGNQDDGDYQDTINEEELNKVPQSSREDISSEFEEFMKLQSLASQSKVTNDNQLQPKFDIKQKEINEVNSENKNDKINTRIEKSQTKEDKNTVLKLIQEEIDEIEFAPKSQARYESCDQSIPDRKHSSSFDFKQSQKESSMKKDSLDFCKSKLNLNSLNKSSKQIRRIEEGCEENLFSSINKNNEANNSDSEFELLIDKEYNSDVDVDTLRMDKPIHVHFSDDENERTKDIRKLLATKTKKELIMEDMNMQELAQMKNEEFRLAKQENPMKKEEFIVKGGQSLPYASEFEQLQMNYEDRNAIMEEIIKERKRYYYIQNKKKRWRKELIKLGPDGIPEEEKLRLEAMKKSVKNEEELAEMMRRPRRVWYTRYQFFKRIKEGKELSKRNRSCSAIGSERIQHMQAAKCLANATLGPNNNLYNSRQRWRRPDLKPVWMYDKNYKNSKIQALRNMREQEEKENDQRKQDFAEENQQNEQNPQNLTGYAKRGGQSYKFNNYRDGNKRQKVNDKGRWYN